MMVQAILRVQVNVSYGGTTTYWTVDSGGLGGLLSAVFGADIARIPVPWACTARNLTIYSRDTTRTLPMTLTLMKNGVATALSATLNPGDTSVTLTGVDISYSQFDDWSYRAVTSAGTSGNIFSWSIEVESAGNVFGYNTTSGYISVGTGAIGGGLGNGFPQAYSLVNPNPLSTSYSICATDGDITTLVLKSLEGAVPVGGSWIAYIIKNLVVQDGSGGTVDTRCTMTAGNTTAVSTFTLPIVKGDRIDIAWYRDGIDAPYSLYHIAVGLGFVPTNAGYFMMTGGSNDAVGNPGYIWNHSAQGETDESLALGVATTSGIVVRGLYVESDPAGPDPADTATYTVRHNEAATVVAVVFTGSIQTTGLIENQYEEFPDGNTIDLQALFDAVEGKPYWGLEATIIGVGPAPPAFGTITVVKHLANSSDIVTSFNIEVGGGLSPASIALKNNESQIYTSVPVGSGYSVTEPTPPAGWELISITTSNGSPSGNITVADGESVVVTVLNGIVEGSGIYEMIKGKTNDTIWIDPGVSDHDVKIP